MARMSRVVTFEQDARMRCECADGAFAKLFQKSSCVGEPLC